MTDDMLLSHALDQATLTAELRVEVIGDLFANSIGRYLVEYLVVQLTQGLPHAFVRIQTLGARVCLVVPDEVAFKGHD